MNKSFTPQATPLYAVDPFNRVNMVVGWTADPDEDGEGIDWWNPVLVLISDFSPDGLVNTYCGARSGPVPAPGDRDSDMAYTPSLEEARHIAIKWRQMDERDRREAAKAASTS